MKPAFASVNTPYCQTKIVTFKEFVKLIPRKEWYAYTDKAGYMRRKTVKSYDPNETDPDYETVFAHLTKTPITISDLVKYLPIQSRPKYSLQQMVYDITTESAVEMGNPTHLVRLGRRFWLAANPDDFIVFFNSNGTAIANLRPSKSVAWLVDKNSS